MSVKEIHFDLFFDIVKNGFYDISIVELIYYQNNFGKVKNILGIRS